MKFDLGRLWLGTESSLQTLLSRMGSADTMQRKAWDDEEDEAQRAPRTSRLVQKEGTLGIVRIQGSLVNGDDAFWNEIFGAVGYGEIRNAVLQLAFDPEVTSIMLDIDSGGGQVSGLTDAAEVLRTVDAHYKPVFAHTGGSMCSAAYFLGSCARRVTAASLAEVGSIGVLVVHRSVARALEENGIDVKVIRSGEFKALGNPYEQLSDEARKTIQQSCDYTYEQFLAHVAKQRGVLPSYVKEHMGEGRVFIGQQAMDVGLVDEVLSLDGALQSALVAKKPNLLEHDPRAFNSQEKMATKTLTPVYAAALAAALQTQQAASPTEADEQPQEQSAENQAGAGQEQAAEATSAQAQQAESQDETVELRAQVALLKQQNADMSASLVDSQVQLRQLQTKLEAGEAARTGLRKIADMAIDHLNIALGRPSGTASTLSDEQAVAEHARLAQDFDANFKAGGVAAVSSRKVEPAQADPFKAARIKAARLK